jgi:phenylacetate-CoA ligase
VGVAYYSRLIDDVIHIPRSERTLVLICFGMGIWVAGTYTLLAFEQLGDDVDRNLTVASPGMEVDDVGSIFVKLAPHFKHCVVAGYPAALNLLFKELARRNITPPGKLHLVTSGDKIDEDWRDAQMRELRIGQPTSVVNVYGSADGGLLAIETPLSIEIRRRLRTEPDIAGEVFGDAVERNPALFQFDPALFWFEEVGGELVFTADLDVPMIRYNIHDSGKVIPYWEMIRDVERLGIDKRDAWEQAPFLVVSGRSDLAIVVYGAKV